MRFLIYIPNIHSIEAKQLFFNIYGVNIMTNIDKIKETASNAEDKIKETASNAENMARKVWLAGIGAYGKGYEEIKGRFEALSSDSNKLFDELVVKGQKLEAEGKSKVKEVTNKVKDVTNKVEKATNKVVAKTEVESRIETVRSKLGLNNMDNDQKIEELSAKIDSLTAAVAKLAAKPAAKTAAKPAAKTAAKPAAKTAAKPAAKTEAKPAAKTEAKPVAKTAEKKA
jgi:poly(hydroxyalkanoate) granule-associated protein